MTIHQSPDDSPSGSQDSPSDASNGFGAGLSTPASADSEPRRKRPSSSRRRTTKKATGESTQRSQEEAASPAGAKRRARKSKRSTGRTDQDERPSSSRSEEDRDDDRPKRTRRSRSRGRAAGEERASESEKRSDASSSRPSKAAAVVGFLPEDGDGDADQDKGETRSKSATRRKRPARTRSRRKAGRKEDDDRDEREEDEEEDSTRSRSRKSRSSKAKKATKKRTRRKTKRSGKDRDDSDEDREDEDRDESEETPKRKRRASKKRSKASKTPEELAAEEEALRTKTILVNATDPEERRVVLVEGNGRIEDLLMTAESQKNLVNDIYRGKVVNLEPAIGAAFVDFGQGRNGFLHTSDVMPVYGEDDFTLEKLLTTRLQEDDADLDLDDGDLDDDFDDGDDREEEEERPRRGRGRSGRKKKAKAKASGSAARRGRAAMQRRTRQRLPITDLLKVGDPVVVQITKDAIGDKGPTLTTYISIPGRYLVLMPSMARTGVSRKIPDENERRRLKRILAQLDAPEEMGVIVRTAGVGKLKTDLKRDLSYLLGVWKTFEKKLKTGRGPTPLYQESDVATRTLRDLFNKETKEVVVDDFAVHEQMMEFAERLMPEHAHRISRYEGQRPIFHHFGIEQDFEVIFNRRVELPSGGSIVFDQAEALVAIDVNSGRTRTGSHDFEEIALKTNLEAVPEIALQIRLRDLGGIIVCDFIDMMKSSSNRAVEKALRSELAKDRARSKMGRIGQFGLLEMTRQRLGPGTHKKVFQACPRCRGTGRIRTVQSRAQAILRRLGSALTQKGFSTVEVRAHPEVVQYIKDKLWDYVRALEHRFERELRWTEVPDQPEDSVLRYLRTDGREVRPGGRRKR